MGQLCCCSCPDDFEEFAAKCLAVCACLKKTPSADAANDDSMKGESMAGSEDSAAITETPAADGDIALEDPAVKVESALVVKTGAPVVDEQAAGAPAQAPESATAEMTPQVEAAPIAGSPNKKKTWGIEHF